MLSQAKDWESRAEYGRAIDVYLKLSKSMTQNFDILEDAWTKVILITSLDFASSRILSMSLQCNFDLPLVSQNSKIEQS